MEITIIMKTQKEKVKNILTKNLFYHWKFTFKQKTSSYNSTKSLTLTFSIFGTKVYLTTSTSVSWRWRNLVLKGQSIFWKKCRRWQKFAGLEELITKTLKQSRPKYSIEFSNTEQTFPNRFLHLMSTKTGIKLMKIMKITKKEMLIKIM